MALTSSVTRYIPVKRSAFGGMGINLVRFTTDAAYPDGGYPVTAALAGFTNEVIAVIPIGLVHTITTTNAETGFYPSFDAVDKTLQVFHSGGGASTDPAGEAATNLATIDTMVFDAICIGS